MSFSSSRGLHDQLALTVDSLLRSFIVEHSYILRNRLGKEPFAALLWTARLPARIGSTGHSATQTLLQLNSSSLDGLCSRVVESRTDWLLGSFKGVPPREYLGGDAGLRVL